MPKNRHYRCPLCGTSAPWHHTHRDRQYALCPNCDGIFMDPADFLGADEEHARYVTHNNDVNDPGYRNFVHSLVEQVKQEFTPNHAGLDFGAGPGPVAAVMLREAGYSIREYDPFFHPDSAALLQHYDYIIACEVIEHFYDPAAEFSRLRGMLRDGGLLLCKTLLWDERTDFTRWFYQNDETHTFFYSARTMDWICRKFGFSRVEVNKRVIALWA